MVVLVPALWFPNPVLVLKPIALVWVAVVSGCIGFVLVPPESRTTPLGMCTAVVAALTGMVAAWWIARAVERSAGSRGAVARDGNEGKAAASLVLGLISIFSMGVPLIFAPAAIAGIAVGIRAVKSQRRVTAIAGIALSTTALVIGVPFNAWIMYLDYTGQRHIFNPRAF